MHIKFLSHGQGSAAGAIRYLLRETDHADVVRSEVSVLRGDPKMVAEVADSSRHKWRYTSGVIAWAPDDQPTPEQIQQVIEQWEATAFAGLDADQYASCAVLHRDDDGTPHIHTITARVELSTGHSLNIAPPGHERLFDPLRDYWNHKMGWARPDDPDRARDVQPGTEQHRSRPDRHPQSRAEIMEYIEGLAAEGLVTNAADVRAALSEIGEITRASASYVSVRPEGFKKPVRLRGDVFRDDWEIEQSIERESRRASESAAGRAGGTDPTAAKSAQQRLKTAVSRREAYNRERYQRDEPELGETVTTDRKKSVDSSKTGRKIEPDGRLAELDAVGSNHSSSDAGSRWRDGRWPIDDRPADRQPDRATVDPERRNTAAGEPAPTAPGRRDPQHSGPAISNRDRPANGQIWDNQQRTNPSDTADGGLKIDRIGNDVIATITAAAARFRAASDRIIGAARQTAIRTVESPATQRTATSRDSSTRRQKHHNFQRSNDAHRLFDRSARAFYERSEPDRIERVLTAYQAWTARQLERDRQDKERSVDNDINVSVDKPNDYSQQNEM